MSCTRASNVLIRSFEAAFGIDRTGYLPLKLSNKAWFLFVCDFVFFVLVGDPHGLPSQATNFLLGGMIKRRSFRKNI
jgi:hypothetical protein